MTDNYLTAPGVLVKTEEFITLKAKGLAFALQMSPYVRLLECRRISGCNDAEVVVFETEVELGQRRVHDIHAIERIAVVFSISDAVAPEVLALRTDFPKVPHLNLRTEEFPRSLCLYEDSYDQIKLRWTPIRFIERIRDWLALTAKGRLHGQNQPLEPLLVESIGEIIIPYNLFSHTNLVSTELLAIRTVDGGKDQYVLIAERISEDIKQLNYVATAVKGAPQTHGIINKQPENLQQLHQFLLSAEVDLLSELRQRLKIWQANKPHKYVLDAKLALIIDLPKKREEEGPPETSDIWAFLSTKTIREIGKKIGIWGVHNNDIATLLFVDEEQQGQEVEIYPLRPMFSFSRKLATILAGQPNSGSKKIVAVGVGALGSQVFMNLIRMGLGTWTLIDDDCLLPHNLSRHVLHEDSLGSSKAQALAQIANKTIDGEIVAHSIVANILKPGESKELIDRTLADADLIFDFSASVAVARYIGRDTFSQARRVSFFLNPSGFDLVMLSEDKERKKPLDYIEMLYYRHLISFPGFEKHLKTSNNTHRYANSCRDVSSTIPQELVALHAAICSRAVRSVLSEENCIIRIWRADPETIEVKCTQVDAYQMMEYKIGDWKVCTDQWLLDKVFKARELKLPNETGGVLIGSFDMERRIVYVIDTLLSPPDSKEWPTTYIRGCQGLARRMKEINDLTAGMLEYVGEWHSHPNGYGCVQSADDHKAFIWLANNMFANGLPAVMLIAGNYGKHAWYLECMS